MKKLLVAVLVLGSFSSFAGRPCNVNLNVDIPSNPYVNTGGLDDTRDIFAKIEDKGYVANEKYDYIINVKTGTFTRSKIVSGGHAVRYKDYIYSVITVTDKNEKVLFKDEKEKWLPTYKEGSIQRITLLNKHIKKLPKCSKL
jgi:hypothetical protein